MKFTILLVAMALCTLHLPAQAKPKPVPKQSQPVPKQSQLPTGSYVVTLTPDQWQLVLDVVDESENHKRVKQAQQMLWTQLGPQVELAKKNAQGLPQTPTVTSSTDSTAKPKP